MEKERLLLGMDVSKDELVVCLMAEDQTRHQRVIEQRIFENAVGGFRALHRWLHPKVDKDAGSCRCVLEATGVYSERIAHALYRYGYPVSIVLPLKARHYAQSLTGKSKTDAIDARMLAQLGLERRLPTWAPMNPQFQELRNLTRERSGLKDQVVRLRNQQHAQSHAAHVLRSTAQRTRSLLAFLERQITKIDAELATIVAADDDLARRVAYCTSIPGVSMITVVTVIAETNGFAQITNRKQLASYAGLDVVQKESGKRAGRTSISKRGNGHIRAALYMPALCATRHNPILRSFYARVNATHTAKLIGVMAVARKLLLLIYTLWKSGVPYDAQYGQASPAHDAAGLAAKPQSGKAEETTMACTIDGCSRSQATMQSLPLMHGDRGCIQEEAGQEPSSVHILLSGLRRDANLPLHQWHHDDISPTISGGEIILAIP